jgi:hypothetical protein
MKNELNTCFQQKFATCSYGVGIGHAWCSRKACEICSSLAQKKKLKKNYFSSHKLPKQQSTSFWSQGILGVKLKFGGGNLFSPAMTSTIEGNNYVGSLLKPLLKKVTRVVGSRMLCPEASIF